MVDHDFPIPQLSPSGAAQVQARWRGVLTKCAETGLQIISVDDSLQATDNLMITKQDLRIGSQDFSSPKRLQVFGKETFTNT
jgi:hypothetical protein